MQLFLLILRSPQLSCRPCRPDRCADVRSRNGPPHTAPWMETGRLTDVSPVAPPHPGARQHDTRSPRAATVARTVRRVATTTTPMDEAIRSDRPRWLSDQAQVFFATNLSAAVAPHLVDWMIRDCETAAPTPGTGDLPHRPQGGARRDHDADTRRTRCRGLLRTGRGDGATNGRAGAARDVRGVRDGAPWDLREPSGPAQPRPAGLHHQVIGAAADRHRSSA